MKNILLAVVGLNPQVITETLFGLHQQGRQVDAIHVITTRTGKEGLFAHLLPEKEGRFFRYCREYGIDHRSILFGPDTIHSLKDENGVEIDDITDEGDNARLLKMCLDLSFQLTKDPGAAVFFSIAGGRKTMSACLMTAAQFYGRPQDRVFHVLVTPEFESNRDFFYPPRENLKVELRDDRGTPYFKDTRYAQVNLVTIPFVSVREKLGRSHLRKPEDPATLMLSLVREDPPLLIIDLPSSKLIYNRLEVDMMPARLALFCFFAARKKDCDLDRKSCRNCNECWLTIEGIYEGQGHIKELYRKITGRQSIIEMSDTGITNLNAQNFNSYKAKIRHDLEQGFGPFHSRNLAIQSAGRRPETRYGLKIDREQIRVVF